METLNSGSCRYHYNALDQLTGLEPFGQATLQRFYRLEHLATELGDQVSRSVFQHGSYLLALLSRQGNVTNTQLLGTDQQRSVLQVSDPAGPMNRVYTPYGHRPAGPGPGDLLGFNGEAIDPTTGHYLLGNGHRAFNPILMRFNSPDRLSPFGRGGLNPYAYCQGDPVNFTDPTGREAWLPWMVVGMNVVGFLSGGVGLVAGGLSVAGLRTAGVAASKSLVKKSAYLGVVGAVSGFIGGGVGITRSIMNATDPDNSAQDPLLIVMAAFSVLSFAASGTSVAYAYRAHKLNRAGAWDVARSAPKPLEYKNPLTNLPSAPPPTPGTPQASATLPPEPIGFEAFGFPGGGNKRVDLSNRPQNRQPRIVSNAQDIRRHSR